MTGENRNTTAPERNAICQRMPDTVFAFLMQRTDPESIDQHAGASPSTTAVRIAVYL
jgi:hypothetical protein